MANTKAQFSQVHWGLVLTTAVVVYVVTLLLGLALTVLLLSFFNSSHLDAQRAVQATAVLSAALVMVVTGAGAFPIARTVERAAWLHGFLAGLLVALISGVLDLLFRREIRLSGLLLYALMVLAGWLGGGVGARWRRPLASLEA